MKNFKKINKNNRELNKKKIKVIEAIEGISPTPVNWKPPDMPKLSVEYIISELHSIYKKCMESEDFKNSASAIRSLELLGKHFGMFSDLKTIRIEDARSSLNTLLVLIYNVIQQEISDYATKRRICDRIAEAIEQQRANAVVGNASGIATAYISRDS